VIEKNLHDRNLEVKYVDEYPHILCSHCRAIKKSTYVIGFLINEKAENYAEKNAEISFLLGMASAYGKKLIILQETPMTKIMLDVSGKIREYSKMEDASKIIEKNIQREEKERNFAIKLMGIILANINEKKLDPLITKLDEILELVKTKNLDIDLTNIVARLSELIEDRDEHIRYSTAYAFVKLSKDFPKLIPYNILITLGKDDDYSIRDLSAKSFINLIETSPRALSTLKNIAKNQKGDSRYLPANVFNKLAEIKPNLVPLELLISLTKEEDPYVRCKATETFIPLAKTIPNEIPINILKTLAKDDDSSVRYAAIKTFKNLAKTRLDLVPLEELTAQSFGENWVTQLTVIETLGIFAKINPDSVDLSALEKFAQDGNQLVKAKVAWALGEFADSKPNLIPIEVLSLLAKDDEDNVRESVAKAFVKIANFKPDIIPMDVLEILAMDRDMRVNGSAVEAYVTFIHKEPKVLEILGLLAKDKKWFRRHSVAKALKNLTETRPELVPKDLLEELAKDDIESVQNLARKALQILIDNDIELDYLKKLYTSLSFKIGSYREISKETNEFNKLLRNKFGEKTYKKDRLDAHHVIEARCFSQFKEFFQIFDWHSPLDMPTIALPHEVHIESLKKKLINDYGVSSISSDLKHAIDLLDITRGEDLIQAYKNFYKKYGWWNKVKPLFIELEEKLHLTGQTFFKP